MITYITVTFSSEGAKPSKVFNALNNLGFKPTTGNYDAVYVWDKQATIEDAISLADKVVSTLKGMNVLVKLETVGNPVNTAEED
ncbi:MAG TPA: hypothetical protein VEH08_00820 [Methanomassiliicoccales archaeon]|nr:hypothetical protein [Methanomassiliicoccales archaeon]HXZ23253.1 hypothetical protein [Methanomassiliicoccales archaeon]